MSSDSVKSVSFEQSAYTKEVAANAAYYSTSVSSRLSGRLEVVSAVLVSVDSSLACTDQGRMKERLHME